MVTDGANVPCLTGVCVLDTRQGASPRVRVGLANVGEEVRGLGTQAISGHQRQDPRPRSSATRQNVRPRHLAGRLGALVCSKNHLVHPTLSAATRVTWPRPQRGFAITFSGRGRFKLLWKPVSPPAARTAPATCYTIALKMIIRVIITFSVSLPHSRSGSG